MNLREILGKKFGRLTVIKDAGQDKYKNHLWFCQCDCGEIKITTTGNLNSGKVQSCGCLQGETLAAYWKQRRQTPSIVAFNRVYCGYRISAKSRNLEWALNEDEFRELTQQNCHYCGCEPKQDAGLINGHYFHNGIDRVDSLEGYILNNCVPCCKICNYMKRSLTRKQFINHVRKIVEHANGH